MQLLLKIKPQYFFLFAALYFQWQFNKVTPPLQAPDEFNHFYRALQVSEGQLLPLKQNDRLGGNVPGCIREFVLPYANAATNFKYTLTKLQLYNSYNIKYSNKDRLFYDYPNTALYSPVSYLPQAFAIYVLRKLDYPIASWYYGGRYMIFICWLIAMFFVITIIPYGKWLMTLLILLPMNMYITNSFSADTVTNIISLLFIAYVLKLAHQDKQINYINIILLLLMIVLLAFAKVVYIGLVLLLFVIPPKQFKSLPHYAFSLVILFLSAILVTYYQSNLTLLYYTPFSDYNPAYRNGICLSNCANYYQQKELILSNKMYFMDVICKSIIQHPLSYLNGYIGLFGNSDILLSPKIIYGSYGIIGLVALTEYNEKVTSALYKLIFIGAAFAAFVFLLLSQHLTWDCVGEGIVDLVQGRYLIPIFPLLFLIISNSFFKKIKWGPNIIVIIFVFMIHHYSAKAINNRFFVDSYSEKVEFECGAEKVNDKGYFITSNDTITLEGGVWGQTDSVARTGKHSAALKKVSCYAMIYKFKNLQYGDLIEISAWQKGHAAQFVIAGKGEKCDDFYLPNNTIHYYDDKGWGYMNMVQTVTLRCDSSVATFFVWNPDTTKTVYIDDLKFSIKKFKENYQDEFYSKIDQMNSSRLK